jgi:hypothetical protein
VLFNDSAVAGEAAGYAMGLVMLGTSSDKALEEMLQYAHETQHEKIIRGLAIGISFLFYGKQQEADNIIDTLVGDQVWLENIISSSRLLTKPCTGSYLAIWRYLYYRTCLRGNGRQQGYSAFASCCCLRCQR